MAHRFSGDRHSSVADKCFLTEKNNLVALISEICKNKETAFCKHHNSSRANGQFVLK